MTKEQFEKAKELVREIDRTEREYYGLNRQYIEIELNNENVDLNDYYVRKNKNLKKEKNNDRFTND